MARRISISLALLLWSGLAGADQGATIAALTPGRDGRAELHLELQDDALRGELGKAPTRERFRVLLRVGQGKVAQAGVLDVNAEGVHTVLAFDQSASFRPHLNDAMALANKFIGASPARASFTVLSFGTTLGDPRDAPSPAEAQRLLSDVAKSTPQYQTRLKASIRESSALASQRLPMPRGVRQVVVFTDAGEESSVYTTEQVITEARQRGVRVHTVVLGSAKGTTLAQRRDEMKRLAEDTGGRNVEVRDRTSAAAFVEAAARSSGALVRLSLEFCDIPPTPPLRDEPIQVEVLRGGSVVASTSWVSFNQQAGGAASRSCTQPVPSASPAPARSASPVVDAAPTPTRSPLGLLIGLGVLGAVAAVLAFVVRGRLRPAPAPPPAPVAPPLPPAPPSAAPWVNPQGAPLPTGRPEAPRPELWLVVARAPAGSGASLRLRNGLVVGASAGSDLRLDVNEVSSRHAVLEVGPAGEVFVLDQGSTNGTFLEGQRLSPGQRVPWKPGQVVSFSTKVEVRLEAR